MGAMACRNWSPDSTLTFDGEMGVRVCIETVGGDGVKSQTKIGHLDNLFTQYGVMWLKLVVDIFKF